MVQPVGEAGKVAEAVADLDNWVRVAVHPHSGVDGEGAVAAQQRQLLGLGEVEADQPAGAGRCNQDAPRWAMVPLTCSRWAVARPRKMSSSPMFGHRSAGM